MKKLASVSLLIFITFFIIVSAGYSQNFVALGSEQAPIKYIKGSGTNIGLYIGVEFMPTGFNLQKNNTGEMGVLRAFRAPAGGSGGMVLRGAGQGFGKANHNPTGYFKIPARKNFKIIDDEMPLLPTKNRPGLPVNLNAQDETDFQLLPMNRFVLEKGTTAEIFLPILCFDQNLDVPPSSPDPNFTMTAMSDTVQQAYVGIYRFDQYLNQNLISKIWSVDDFLAWYEGTVTDAEYMMMSFSYVEIDPNSYDDPPAGYYTITHAHLYPGFAQWVIWAASHNQNMQSFLDGYNYIGSLNGESPVPADSIIDYYYLNHLVFQMAEMADFKDRFSAPNGANLLTPPNLKPYALIQTDPSRFDEQNNSSGIEFSAKYSFDADGGIKSYKWDFDGGSISDSQIIKLKFKNQISDSTPVILTVKDDRGEQSKDTVFVPYSEVNTKIQMDDFINEIPTKFELNQNYPNPMFSATRIPFKIITSGNFEIQIFNLLGQQVKSIANHKLMPGTYQLSWDGKDNFNQDVPAGIYFYQIKSDDFVQARKLVIIR
jgi:hypothetical protein